MIYWKKSRIIIIVLLVLGVCGLCYFGFVYGHPRSWSFDRLYNWVHVEGKYGTSNLRASTKLASNKANQSKVTSQIFDGSLHVPIFMYHHVANVGLDADRLQKDLTVSPEAFEAELDWLSRNDYHSVTLAQVYLATQKQFELPTKPIVFTFDDGYLDVFANAVPLLIKYNFVGSFAVVPGFFGQDGYTTWELVKQAKTQGMEIVSHTETHFDGTSKKFDPEFIRQNLEQSLRELDAHLGTVPRVLVYPYGHYNDEYINVAKQVGFVMGLTTAYGQYVHPDTLMTTSRVRVHGGETLGKFIEVLTGIKQTAAK